MNTRSSSYTGRSARTLNEAFGPYQDHISEPSRIDKAAGVAIWVVHAIAAVAVVALIAAEHYFA